MKSIVGKVAGVVGGLLVGYLGIDAVTWLALDNTPTMVAYGGADNRTAVMASGGAGADPVEQFSEMIQELQKHGHAFVAKTAPDGFSAEKMINLIIETVPPEKYDRLLVVGASKSGLLAYDLAKTMRDRGDNRPVGIVMIDSPLLSEHVVGVPAPLRAASILPLGAITNLWFHPPFEEGDISKMSPNVNKEELFRLWDSYKTWKASCWVDEGRYVFWHGDVTAPIPGVTWSFVLSTQDTFIDSEAAYAAWVGVVGPMSLRKVAAGHISLHDWAAEYNSAVSASLTEVAAA